MSGSAGCFPVKVYWEGGEVQGYAKGGLVDEARSVRGAGRNGDSQIIHVNRDELEQLRQQWGEPTINPETGMPEFFLGGLGKFLKKVGKVALPIAGLAANFIPGIGPLASAAIGAATGAGGSLLNGGGLKGALLGGAMGALPGAMKGLSGAGKVATTAAQAAPATAAQTVSQVATPVTATSGFGVDAATQAAINSAANAPLTAAAPAATGAVAPAAAAAKPNFWNRNFLGTGIKNKYAVPALGLGAIALGGGFKSPKEDPAQTQDQFFGDKFSGTSMPAPNIGTGSSMSVNHRPAEEYARAGYMPEYKYFGMAKGGSVPPMAAKKRPAPPKAAPKASLAVKGKGTGRSDDIDAKLSDGEYVMDAESVSMLGDGSNKAGAKALDNLRVNVRKHKGAKLAKGKMSGNAKAPEAYMKGAARG